MHKYHLSHLSQLENEAIFVMREVASQFEKPVLLFSGGKDSIVMVRLAQKAFWPAKIPFPLMHIDTGHNFEETIIYRDELVKEVGAELMWHQFRNPSIKVGQWKKRALTPAAMCCKP
jgi:sulfate adenylyltransferase subunit 2